MGTKRTIMSTFAQSSDFLSFFSHASLNRRVALGVFSGRGAPVPFPSFGPAGSRVSSYSSAWLALCRVELVDRETGKLINHPTERTSQLKKTLLQSDAEEASYEQEYSVRRLRPIENLGNESHADKRRFVRKDHPRGRTCQHGVLPFGCGSTP